MEIGRYEGVLCVSSDRRPSRLEDQAPDLLQMTEKNVRHGNGISSVASHSSLHPFVAFVRCIR